jgi:hypothetical protein
VFVCRKLVFYKNLESLLRIICSGVVKIRRLIRETQRLVISDIKWRLDVKICVAGSRLFWFVWLFGS